MRSIQQVRDARAAERQRRIDNIDANIAMAEAVSRGWDSITIPGIDVDELVATGRADIRSLLLGLERLRGYDE